MHLYLEDTICAPATSTGGAVAMIRVSGANSLPIVDKVVKFKRGTACDSKGYSLKFGSVPGLDDVVVAIYRNPNSYTGEDSAEISCHASPFIVSSLLSLLIDAGCRSAEAGEFTRRAFVNGKMDLAQAEAVADVISSTSLVQHRIALNQLRGGYSAQLALVRGQLLELASLLELELDFSEEELEFADRGRLAGLLDSAISKCGGLADSFRLGNAIKNGVPVAIVGSPNSGKSTLLNALLEEDRAIVSSVAGTTRDTIEETCTLGGVVFRFIDTAGIRESSDVVEKLGIERSFAKASSAEIVIGVVDVSSGCSGVYESGAGAEVCGDGSEVGGSVGGTVGGTGGSEGNRFDGVCSAIRELIELEISGKFVLVLNKIDKFSSIEMVNNFVTSVNDFVKSIDYKGITAGVVAISAKNGFGLEELRNALVSQVGTVSEDAILVTNARHAAALRSAAQSLEVVRRGLSSSAVAPAIPADLLAEDLREAIRVLGTITGEITTDEVLGNIFKNFCIGK